ncbi:MAG TPA: hypothetical protein VGH90_09835 [Chthoniobacteraceae bacterium]
MILVSLAFLGSETAFAKGKKKKDDSPQTETEPAGPVGDLAPYIENLDALLALQSPHAGKAAAFRNAAPGKLVILKTSLLAKRTAATPPDQASIDAAIATCDKITAAMDEREKFAAQIQTSKSVKGSGTLGLTKKANLSEGVHGDDLARAVAIDDEAKRERKDAKDAKKRTAQDESFMSSAAQTEWNKHAIALRQDIVTSFQQIAAPQAPAQPGQPPQATLAPAAK